MHKRLALGIGAAVLTGTIAAASAPAAAAITSPAAAPAPAAVVQVSGLASTIALSNCSAALVRYPTSLATDRALMLTNGHCYEGGMPPAGQVLQNRASSRSGRLLDTAGNVLGTVRADRVIYATMTGTDVALYQLTETFAALRTRLNATALTISASHPTAGTNITIPSGYWRRVWTCQVNGFAYALRESQWTWRDSIRYDTACDTIGGTSGSPVVSTSTGEVIGINNTGNENGRRCTLNNPCEVDENGTVTVRPNQNYGQQTYWFTTCLTASNAIDLSKQSCLLAKPAAALAPEAARAA